MVQKQTGSLEQRHLSRQQREANLRQQMGRRIRDLRLRHKMTQWDVALSLGKSSAVSVSDIERGRVCVSVLDLFQLSLLFQVPIIYFFVDGTISS